MLCHATGVLAALVAAASLAAPPALPPRLEGGRSVRGTPIVAVRSGAADAPVRLLVTGSIHGTEPAGLAGVRRLRGAGPPPRGPGGGRRPREPPRAPPRGP